MHHYTIRTMAELVAPLSIANSGLLFFPPQPSKLEVKRALKKLLYSQRLRKLQVDRDFIKRMPDPYVAAMGGVVEQACEQARRGVMPPWVKHLPRPLRQLLVRDRLFTSDEELQSMHGFELSGFDYAVTDDPTSLLARTEQAFRNHRLGGIRQWGYLEYSMAADDTGWLVITDRCPHMRQGHMRDAYALMTLITENIELPSWVKIVLRIAALTHDVFTIAGGDSMKWCDSALHEERLYAELLPTTGWKELVQTYGLPEEEATRVLIDTVQGRGAYRDLLKIVDWLAYLGRDIDIYKCLPQFTVEGRSEHRDLSKLIRSNLRLCGIWEMVCFKNGQMHLTDIKRYLPFAQIRMKMYHSLYLHPHMRYREFLMASVIGQTLYQEGVLTREDLLRWTDFELDQAFCEALGLPSLYALEARMSRHQIELFQRREEALARERALLEDGVELVFVEDLFDYRIKPGTHLRFRTPNGRARSFGELRRGAAKKLEALSKLEHPVRLYYARSSDLPDTLQRGLKNYHTRRRELLAQAPHNP